jgi:divalent metal cation (Fe/Co/Zn/Cd) transporter
LLLVGVSLVLARESRSLLMGEGISAEIKNKVIATAEKDPAVLKVQYVLATYRAPEDVLVMLIIAFKPDLDTADINESIVRIRTTIMEQHELIKFVAVQPEELGDKKKPGII